MAVEYADNYLAKVVQVGETSIFTKVYGKGTPLLLLHGFPETSLLWREIAPILASAGFQVICADLRGYGDSSCPLSDDKHLPYSKRVMAQDMVEVMQYYGHQKFAVVGHDRGGRVAYRLALDHPKRIERLALLDILPTKTVWDLADDRLAIAYWPWSLLAQPEPLPEKILTSAADEIVDNALRDWGSNPGAFPASVRTVYIKALSRPESAHAICEEYRAAVTVDREHDQIGYDSQQKITCPTLVLWAAGGPLDTWYSRQSGPLALWGEWAPHLQGQAVDGGHFFPETKAPETATLLRSFLLSAQGNVADKRA